MKFSSYKNTLLAGCSIMAAAGLATSAAAQDAADDDVIVVTAQNRAEDVQDVPIAIDVIGAGELAEAGFNSANDLGAIAPAVQVNQDQGTVKITVRGIGTNSNDEAQDTSVVTNIDGEYINRGNVLGIALFDLERVEVLRGPQGTLYGRNSTAGAINFITRKPGGDFGVDASASYGNYNDINLTGGIDIPIGDTAGVRFAGFYNDRDGYVSHPAGYGFGPFPAFAGGRSDDNNSYGGRVSFQIDDDDNNFMVNLAAEYARQEFTPQAFAFADLNSGGRGPTGTTCNVPGFVEVAPAYTQVLCVPSGTNYLDNIDRSNYASPGFGLGAIGQDTYALRGRFSYEFSPAAMLTYTGGYRHFEQDSGDFLTLPVSYRSYTFEDFADTQSHELRLNGDIGGVIYQVGGFYFKETLESESGFLIPAGGPAGTFLSYFGRDITSESTSLFGQVEVPLGDVLTAVGGLRYTDNSREALYRNATPFGAGPPDCVGLGAAATATNCLFGTGFVRKTITSLPRLVTRNLGSAEDKVTWLLGLNYTPNPETLIYAKASTGFKGGGFDSVGTYAPETNTAYEVGGKFNFGDGAQHILNVSGFYYDYTDLQVSVLLDTTVGGQTFNAGAATIWGLEAELAFEITENTLFNLSANYLNAEFDELFAQFNVYTIPGTGSDINGIGDLDPGTAGVQSPNFAGNRPPFAPEWVITAGISHEFDMGSSGSITAAADTMFKSSYFTDFFNYSDGQQDSFTQSNASLEWSPESGMFSVAVFVRNIEDERALTYGSFVSAGPDDIFNWQFGRPRTYGVRVGFEY